MNRVAKRGRKGKKRRVLEPVEILSAEEYSGMAVDARIEAIQALIPLGLMHVQEELCREVVQLAGRRHERPAGGKGLRAVVQHCQWHKRENVLKYLPKGEQGSIRRRLQCAYQKPTYRHCFEKRCNKELATTPQEMVA